MDDPQAPQQAPAANAKPRARRSRRLAALAVGLLITIALGEGGVRAWRSLNGNPYDGARAALDLQGFVERLKGLNFTPQEPERSVTLDSVGMSLHPYEGYQVRRSWEGADNPGDYFRSQEGLDTYDVLLLGGSVAAEFGNWSHKVLAPLLQADPRLAGRKVKIHNRACPGHKQPQLATNLIWAFSLGIRPDAVLLLDGFNDLAVAAGNAEYDVHPLYPFWWEMEAASSGPHSDPAELEIVADIFAVRRSAERLAARAKRWGLMHSVVLGSIVEREFEHLNHRSRNLVAALEKKVAQRTVERPLFVRGPPFVNEPANVLRMSGLAWMEGSRTMQAACRIRGIHFVHVLQPAARDIGSKPLTEKEDLGSREPQTWRDAIEKGYPRLREAGAHLVREGINFHDGSRVFADHPEDIYIDTCHFREAGCTILARFIAQAMLESWPKE